MPRKLKRPQILVPYSAPSFPDPNQADDEGLLAIGGDLSAERLLFAYESGIFPWYSEDTPELWWSPNPRCVMDQAHLHVSRSMARELRRSPFSISYNCDFRGVMLACAARAEGTWIFPEMISAYTRLHELGHAHSVEIWDGENLTGGLYGVQRGSFFAAESMFHRATNASKIALITCIREFFASGIQLFDVQFLTPHLASLGAYEISRPAYLERLQIATAKALDLRPLFTSSKRRVNPD